MGVSLVHALDGAKRRHDAQGLLVALLFALGVFTSLCPHFDFSTVRVLGVLQRTRLVFFGCSVISLTTGWRAQLAILGALLVGYAVLLQVVPVPGAGPASLAPEANRDCRPTATRCRPAGSYATS